MISIKGHEYYSAQSSYQPHDLTCQSFCKTHVSHGNNALSSIAETNSRGLNAFNGESSVYPRSQGLDLRCTVLSSGAGPGHVLEDPSEG
jgi:hypothetical protein